MASFVLRCFQHLLSSALSYPAMRLATQPEHQWCVHSGPLVLGAAPTNSPTPTADRDRTVSRRSKTQLAYHFKWRTAIPLGPTSAPGCDEPTSRCQTTAVDMNSWAVSACYPRVPSYPLSDGPSISEPPDHYDLLSYLLDLSVSQLSLLIPLH